MRAAAAPETRRPPRKTAVEGAVERGDRRHPGAISRLALAPAVAKAPAGVGLGLDALVATLEVGDCRRVAGVLAAVASKLLERVADEGAQALPGDDWHTGDDLVARGYFPSDRALRETVASGKLKGSRVGRAIVVERAELDRFLRERAVVARPRKVPAPPPAPDEDPIATALRAAGLERRRTG